MRDIETKISPLISGLFPSFYQEEGPNFIAFVKAYYEWLEQNFQLLDLESIANFNVGDTVTQDTVTGTIYAILDNSILVLVNGLETFKCFNVCSDLTPITSSSGGESLILRGGTTRRLGSLFLSRNLLNIRDIDHTIDLFVVRFKEKYLKNIEFDTQTNKRLLVKNSLDLYRSKGTSRAIDLFFRLIYGIKPNVYTPGDDLFKLSEGEWYRPQYIEIDSSSTDRAISLVGRQIAGINSGATAFVERYVKKKVKKNIVHLLYVSNVRGTFLVNERIKYDKIYDDSPKIIGSLTRAEVVAGDGSDSFAIGDLIDIESRLGDYAVGRVTAVVNGDGKVSFRLADGGWGYTINTSGTTTVDSANTSLSDKVITLANVAPGQFITSAEITNAGTGYSNSDTIYIYSKYNPAVFLPTTNNTGSVVSLKLMDRGNGYFPDEEEPFIQAPGSSGTNLALSYSYEYPTEYFYYLEDLSQNIYIINYNNETNESQFTAGERITIDVNGVGSLLTINTNTNTMRIAVDNKHQFFVGEVIRSVANSLVTAQITAIQSTPVTGKVIYSSPTATLQLGIPTGVFERDDTVYQIDTANNVVAQATVTRTTEFTLAGGAIEVKDLTGVFRPGQTLYVFNKTATAPLTTVSLKVAVTATSNTFVDTGTPFVYSSNSGIKGYTSIVSAGAGAQYKIASIGDQQTVYVNTDRLSNTTLLNTSLNALAYNLPALPAANLSSIIFGGLTFVDLTLGTIGTLGEINPGSGYTSDPIASPFQPDITGYNAHDYIITITGNETQYSRGELVSHTVQVNSTRIFVEDASGYRKGEFVHAANTTVNFIANGVITAINTLSNFIDISPYQGTVPSSNQYTIKSLFSTANSKIISASTFITFDQAKGIVKSTSNDKVYVKRIQLDNKFQVGAVLSGNSSGTESIITDVSEDYSTPILGLNAQVNARASTANGVIGSVQIVDSGFGFSFDKDLTFTSKDQLRSGSLLGTVGGVGTGTGYYRNTRGFVSDLSKLHDGDYYQEYSYDIISRLPLDKYSDMFKKVIHTAGTRFFGSVLIDTLVDIGVSGSGQTNSSITIETSPYVIEDRQDIEIADRNDFFIEIREF